MAEDVMISIQWRQADVSSLIVDRVASGIVQAIHPIVSRTDVWHDHAKTGDLVQAWIRVAAGNLAETERTCRAVMAALDVLTESSDAQAEQYEAFIARRAAERKARVKP